MGRRILERGDVIRGSLVVQPNDDLFWFCRPRLILFLIHFVLFENAFQLAFFAWSWYEFGYPSCYHENLEDILIRILMGILIQVLCSYVTLPLYALVTQMGSTMKPVIFSNQVATALRGWHKTAKKHVKEGTNSANTTPFSSRPAFPLHGSTSPVYLLQGQSEEGGQQASPRASDFSNESWGGGDQGTSTSPTHQDNIDDFNRKDRLPAEASTIKIERDIEDPSTPDQLGNRSGQHDLHVGLNEFSFRKKEESGN